LTKQKGHVTSYNRVVNLHKSLVSTQATDRSLNPLSP
jgi:hypothetical protein